MRLPVSQTFLLIAYETMVFNKFFYLFNQVLKKLKSLQFDCIQILQMGVWKNFKFSEYKKSKNTIMIYWIIISSLTIK